MKRTFGMVLVAVAALTVDAFAQEYSRSLLPYRVVSNVTYVKSGQWEGKLDVYSRINPPGPEPTLIWIHGGGALGGTKEGALFNILPSVAERLTKAS
jgi:acetyl esterase/lipase